MECFTPTRVDEIGESVIGYLSEDELGSAEHEWYLANGFVELNRTRRGWSRQPTRREVRTFDEGRVH